MTEPSAQNAGDDGTLAIYVHWPFCAAKCPYCDFNSHVRHGGVDQARYAAALVRELETARVQTGAQTVTSVFFGGGTPSLMEPATVERVLEAIARLWPATDDCEISLEANPSSVEADRFAGYRDAGVNRVSLGVQSLRDTDLRFLGRLHDVAAARRAIDIARSTFDRMSCDLIYARPGQTVAAWESELDEMLAFSPDHLSLYQLTIEPETPFHRLHAAGKFVIPDDDRAADLFETTQIRCAAAGLPAYEVSNHARPGAECRHNLTYWRGGDYVGVGPGAHGRITVDGIRHATATALRPEDWLGAVEESGHGRVETTPLSDEERAEEFLVMGLRLGEGLDLARFRRRYGYEFDPKTLDLLEHEGLIRRPAGDRIAATGAGMLVLNSLIAELGSRTRLATEAPSGYAGSVAPSGPASQPALERTW
ncbi:radical SAM family heme chaperone HemW [Amorphus orientalis]|uniref:Heme chaperone HemW n=1 Tax=Amorphus orientalis TaxID=649198 RepID=A0AAE3VKI8_9HYPH|nr:radical SAM family heme chaperone HemW [Amorphus orientalis]MDQ0313715.1 oxygen-independent coproporphyrinogen-3 oxidase [Amorphus orientalis]